MKIEFIEQPSDYHRFRYETEVSGGKLGGLLYGRHGSKSYVRLRVWGIDPAVHKTVIVIGGTVNPDLYPHPFFMVGDNCSNGAFQVKKDTDSLGGKGEFEISLEKVSIVCVSTKGSKLQEAIDNRKKINFNPFKKNMDDARYNSRNLKSVRLVFQLFFTDFTDQPVPTDAIVRSDVINDFRQQAKLGIFDIHPNQVCFHGSQEIWIYFEEALPHTDQHLFKAEMLTAGHGTCPCTVKCVRKHLLIVNKPDASAFLDDSNERLKCHLVITDTKNEISDQRDIILVQSQQEPDLYLIEAPQKRKRVMPTHKPEVSMDDLLSTFG